MGKDAESCNCESRYIYVITNKVYEDKFVKIGIADNVENRIDSLKTASPYQFLKYATLKSDRAADIENAIKSLVEIVDSSIENPEQKIRVSPDREFYRLKPQKAAQLIQTVATLMGETAQVRTHSHKEAKVVHDYDPYKCKSSGADATGHDTSDGKFVVEKGSRIGPEKKCLPIAIKKERQQLFNDGTINEDRRFVCDHEFPSAAYAAKFVTGRSANKKNWISLDGVRTYPN